MNKDELIKEPNKDELKTLIDKYNFTGNDSIYSISAEMYNEWYESNKNRSTSGGKLSSYDLAGTIEIFTEELAYIQDCD